MKKTALNAISAIVGFGVMLALWCAGAFCYEYSFENGAFVNKYDIVPTIIVFAMPVLLLIATVVGKKLELKTLYYSSLIGVGLPVLSYFLFCLFSDDGNILSWIFGFSLGLLLTPFHFLAWRTFEGVWLYPFGISSEFCAGLLAFSVIVSVFLYIKLKPIKKKN